MPFTEPAAPDAPTSPPRSVRPPTPADLAAARAAVAAHLAPTPLVPAELPGVPGQVLLKLESLQPTGSFKVRGALAALAAGGGDGDGGDARPVVTASAGNHGLGLAFAARRLGVPATVVVPTTASAAKVEALRRMDVDLVQHGDDYEAAERHALALAAAGARFVSPYNDPHVVAGQATVADEIAAQLGGEGDVTVVVPVGGGGLVAGIALGAEDRPGMRVVGVEAAASPAVSAAVAAGGRTVRVPVRPSLADGLGGNLEPGSITPGVAAGRVHAFVPVEEDRIAAAVRTLATRAGLVTEGAAAVGVAALMDGTVPLAGRPVVVVTGRNIAPELLARLLAPAGDGR